MATRWQPGSGTTPRSYDGARSKLLGGGESATLSAADAGLRRRRNMRELVVGRLRLD